MKRQYIQLHNGIVLVNDIIFMQEETIRYGGTVYVTGHGKIKFDVPNSFFERPDVEDLITKHFFVITLQSSGIKFYVNKHNRYKFIHESMIEFENGYYLKLTDFFTWENTITITDKIITYIKECQSNKILK